MSYTRLSSCVQAESLASTLTLLTDPEGPSATTEQDQASLSLLR